MKSFRKVLLIITVLALLCVLVACGENAGNGSTPSQGEQGNQGGQEQGGGQGEQGGSEVKPLDTPYLVLDGEVASWKPIDNADGYEIELNGNVCGETNETSYKLQNGDSLRVRAISNDPNKYKDSEFSNTVKYNAASKQKLNTPVIKFDYTDGKQVTWEAVDNATSYVCEINGGSESVITDRRIGPYPFGTAVRVKARDDGNVYADSDYSESVTIGSMSDCTQVTDLSEYVGTYMTFDAEKYVIVSEDNKVTIRNNADSDDSNAEEVRIFVKQEGENALVLAKGDDYITEVAKVSDAEAAFTFRDNSFYKLVSGNGFDADDGVYCHYVDQNDYQFANLTQTTLTVDGETYGLYAFANGEKTFCYSDEKYTDIEFFGSEGFRFNDREYRVLRQETHLPYEDYAGLKDNYRLLLRGGDIVFLTYVLEDGKAYFNFDLGSGITARQSLWSFYGGKGFYFTPTDENDLTTLKPVHIESEQVVFGDSLCFDEICEVGLYDRFYSEANGNFVSAEFVSYDFNSKITIDKYGQFLTEYGVIHSNTDIKVFYGAGSYRLFQIDGKYYRVTLEANAETNKTEEIRVVVNSTSGDTIESYYVMKPTTFDFNATYRNNNDSIVLTKEGKLTYDNTDYRIMLIDDNYYAVNGYVFLRIATVENDKFQFAYKALYSTSDLIEATVDEVLSDLEKDTRYQLILMGDRVKSYYSFSISGDQAYYNNRSATLYKDGSGKLTAVENSEGTYPASIITNESGEATIVIDGYEYYKPKAATIPDEYLWKRYYTFYAEDNIGYAQDTLYFANVYDGSEYVKGLFVLNANDNNIIHTNRSYGDRIVEDFDYLKETTFTKESDLYVVGNVYYAPDNSDCTFEFRDNGSLVYGGTVYYEAKEAAVVPAEYYGSYYDQYRRIIEIIDDSAVRTETSRVEILTSAKELSKVYYIENERGARLYLKDFYQTTKYSQSGVELSTHPLRQLVGSNLVKLQETTEELANRYIKPGTYYTRFYNDLYDGYDSHFYEGNGHLDYFGLTFRSFNDVTYVRNAGGYSTIYDKYGNIDSSKITFPQTEGTTAIISQNNLPNRCYYYYNSDVCEYCFVYQFATEAIQICFEDNNSHFEEKTAKFYIYERTLIGYSATDNRYLLVLSRNDESVLKYVSIVEATELPDGMLGNYLMTSSRPDGVTGVYNTDLGSYHRVYKTSDGKFKFQQLRACNVYGSTSFTFFDYDIRYDEATGRYLYGYYRTWTENTALKIDAATDFEPVGELIYDNGTLTVISFNARQSIMDDISYQVVQNESKYAKIVATDVNFATLGMVGKTYFGMYDNGPDLHSIVSVTNADTVNMFINIGSLKFFDAKLIVTSAVENATENSIEYLGYLVSVDDETSVHVPFVITKYESGEIQFRFNYLEHMAYDDFVITEVHESSVLKGVDGVVEFKSRVNGTERAETAIFDSENNTITFYVGDNYECENMQTYTVTKFYYNADESAMYCIADGRVFFFAYADGKIETTLQIQFVARKITGSNIVDWFEFYVPEESEGGETESGESSGEAGGETNA